MVDKEGKPMVVYHGTRAGQNFDEFSTEGRVSDEEGNYTTSGSGADPTAYMGAHFAKEPDVANKFANGSGWMKSRFEQEGEAGPRVIPTFLKLENPKNFGAESNMRQFIYEGDASKAGYEGEEMLNHAMEADGIENPEEGGDEVDAWMEKYDKDPKFRAEQNEWMLEKAHVDAGEGEHPADAVAQELASQAKSRLKSMGHDGAVYRNEVEGGTSYIAFDPKQIKSALTGK